MQTRLLMGAIGNVRVVVQLLTVLKYVSKAPPPSSRYLPSASPSHSMTASTPTPSAICKDCKIEFTVCIGENQCPECDGALEKLSDTPSAITVSLEWAKKLKEAGWEQGITIGNWRPSTNDFYRKQQQYEIHFTSGSYRNEKSFDAPTAEEILRRLPKSVATKNRKVHRLSINCNGGKRWQIMYGDDIFESPVIVDPDDSLANASASMYCYLAENKLLPSS